MKFTSKVKSVFIFLVFSLCVCGILFIHDIVVPIKKNVVSTMTTNQDISEAMIELEKCQSALFLIKNDNEKLKIMPDVRKDIISLLLTMQNIENKLGKQKDLSNSCVKLFSIAYRIPEIHKIADQYKESIFASKCQIATEDELISLVRPFEIDVLDKKYENQSKQKKHIIMKIIDNVLHKTSKATKQMNIANNSTLTNLIIKKQYENALKLVEEQHQDNYQINKEHIDVYDAMESEYQALHNSLKSIITLNKMINDLYSAIDKIETYV